MKSCVVQEKYKAVVKEFTCTQLQQNAKPAASMVHDRRPTLGELSGSLRFVKVGDWVEVEGDYSTGTCASGGIGCVTFVHDFEVPKSDIHYLLTNTREK